MTSKTSIPVSRGNNIAQHDSVTLVAFLVLYGIAAVPILSVPLPPLFDYPNHLARMAILSAAGGDSVLNRYYRIRWSPLPNLAMDAIVPVLAQIMPVMEAGKLFLLMTLLLLAAGPLVLYRALWGRWSPWPCLGFLFLYSRVLLWGFINYLAGVGVAFLAVALWIFLDRKSWWLRGAFGASAGLVVYLCHLEAFGVLALMLVGLEAPRFAAALVRRDWSLAGSRCAALVTALLPASVLFLSVWQPHAAAAWTAPRLDRKPDLLFSVFDNYSRPFDIVCFAGVSAAGIMAAITQKLLIAEAAAWPLVLLALVYLLLPSTLFTGAGADHRLPLVLFLLLSSATTPALLSRRLLRQLCCVGLALFVMRMTIIEWVWVQSGRAYRHDLTSLASLPRGARLAVAAPNNAIQVSRLPLYHLPVLAILLDDAFVPSIFAFATQQPIALVPQWQAVAAVSDPNRVWNGFTSIDPAAAAARAFILNHYDAIAFAGSVPPPSFQQKCLVSQGRYGSFYLYRIDTRLRDCRKL